MVSPNPELLAAQWFACPACHAAKGTACETPAGRPRVPHDQRLEMIGLRQAESLKWQTFTGRNVAGRLEALLRRNAEACENAKGPTCECACGGKYHGKAHSAEWLREQLVELAEEREEERGEFDLFDW